MKGFIGGFLMIILFTYSLAADDYAADYAANDYGDYKLRADEYGDYKLRAKRDVSYVSKHMFEAYKPEPTTKASDSVVSHMPDESKNSVDPMNMPMGDAPISNTKRKSNGSDASNLSENMSEDDESEATLIKDIRLTTTCMEAISPNTEARFLRSIHNSLIDATTTEIPMDSPIDVFQLSFKSTNCTHIYVEPECYEKRPDGSVYIHAYDTVFNMSNYAMNDKLLFICAEPSELFLNAKAIIEHIPIISFVCVVVSSICLGLYTTMFIIFKKMRNLPGYCMMSLVVALLGAYLCFYVHSYADDDNACTLLGKFIFYFFLASFFWMNAIAYDVWKSIRLATAKLRLTTNRPIIVNFARYSVYAWGTPSLIVIASIIVNNTISKTSEYQLAFNSSNCWFEFKQAFVMYFAGPLIILFSLNIFFFGSSFFMISDAGMKKPQENCTKNTDLRNRLFLAVRLGSVMGFLWMSGILATLTKIYWLWYLCAVFSCLQGICILFNYTVYDRLRKAYKRAVQGRKSSVTPTVSSNVTSSNVSSF